jgi:hypothetical protein
MTSSTRTILAFVAVCVLSPLRAANDPLIEGFKLVAAASAAHAMEQLYGKKAYMCHDMRPLAPVKFAGRALTVLSQQGRA